MSVGPVRRGEHGLVGDGYPVVAPRSGSRSPFKISMVVGPGGASCRPRSSGKRRSKGAASVLEVLAVILRAWWAPTVCSSPRASIGLRSTPRRWRLAAAPSNPAEGVELVDEQDDGTAGVRISLSTSLLQAPSRSRPRLAA